MHMRYFVSLQNEESHTVSSVQKQKFFSGEPHIITTPKNREYQNALQLALIGALKVHPLATKYQIHTQTESGWKIELRFDADVSRVVARATKLLKHYERNIKIIFTAEDTEKLLSVMGDTYQNRQQYIRALKP